MCLGVCNSYVMTTGSEPAGSSPQDVLVRAAVDSLTSYGLVVVDAGGVITSWSAGAEGLFGYARAHVEGRSLAFIIDAAAEPAGSNNIVRLMEQTASQARPCQLAFRHSDGTQRIFPALVSPLRVEGGGFALLVADVEQTGQSGRYMDRRCQAPEDLAPQRHHDTAALLATEIANHTDADAARLRLLRRLVVAQEEERLRLAQNLHDDLGQQLTSLRLTLSALRASVEEPSALAQTADSALAILKNIDDAVDFLAWELRPAALEELGLARVIEGYVAEWSRYSSIVARFHSGLTAANRFAPEVEATVYRIAQEALNNVAKHARAGRVNVILEPRNERLVLVVEDDGLGFAGNEANERTMGLSSMRERAIAVGGTVELEPTPGGGTTVLARIPMIDTSRLAALAASSSSPVLTGDVASGGATPTDAVLGALRSRLLELQSAVGARDEFIATVAHELRNPISPLVFQVRLALDKTEQMASSGEAPTVAWVQSQLHRMEQRLHRLLETLDRLLDVSRLATGRIDLQLEPLDLAQVAQEVLSSFEAELAMARCPVSFATSGETTGLWDRLRLEQICRNLVSNAIRFGAGQSIAISVAGSATTVVLTVQDHGVGIAPDQHERIFERFERGVEQRSGGFGIGLWVVKNICTAMGGEISVASELGDGACLTVALPRRLDQATAPPPRETVT